MEEFVAAAMILMMVFGMGAEELPVDVEERDIPQIERQNITGQDHVEIKEYGDIHREIEGKIAGNARVDVLSETGDIFLKFEDKITGNATVNIEAIDGDIYLNLAEEVTGAAEINTISHRGDVYFVGDEEEVEMYERLPQLRPEAYGEVFFESYTPSDLIMKLVE